MPVANFDMDAYLQTVDMVHICGIALSLTDTTVESALTLAKKAHEQGKKVCFDFNFRPSLNTQLDKKQLMKERYEQILPYCDIVFGSKRDLIELLQLPQQEEIPLIQQFLKEYGIEYFAGTKRQTIDEKRMQKGYLITQNAQVESKAWSVEMLDRIGAGDAFAAGILLGYTNNWHLQETVDFSITNAVLKQTIYGDVPLTSIELVQQVMENPNLDIIR
jgi:2-dehydro-3-deoxygluconokinase